MVPPELRHEASRPAPTTVILADDDPIVRRLLRAVLEADGIEISAEARDEATLLAAIAERAPDVALVDVGLPNEGGLAVTRRLTADFPVPRVVLLAPFEDRVEAVEGLRSGASGYLTKDLALHALTRSVRAVAAGEMAISRGLVPAVVGALRVSSRERMGLRPVKSRLTDREWEVLDLLCDGLTTAAIAERLFLSRETVRTHVKHITRKLSVSGRAEAVAKAASLRGTQPVAVPVRRQPPRSP